MNPDPDSVRTAPNIDAMVNHESMAGTGNLIIAGSNKCGTTSVFRYLGAHPSICPSRIKEACFFYTDPGGEKSDVLSRYMELYVDVDKRTKIYLEGSPTYLHGGKKIAESIHESLPDAKILFLLRHPVDRLVSYYKSQFGQTGSAVGRMNFRAFVDESLESGRGNIRCSDQQLQAFKQEFTMARYVAFLPDYLGLFDASQVKIAFFDHLNVEPKSFMQSICDFIAVDRYFYDNYAFIPHNRTRQHSSPTLRRIASNLNAGFEPFINRWPGLRNWTRSLYNSLNTVPASATLIDSDSYERVACYYEKPNEDLRRFMELNYPDQPLPGWLSRG